MLAFLSAILVYLCLSQAYLGWLTAFALIPLCIDLFVSRRYETMGQFFRKGLIFGFTLMTLSHLWMIELDVWAPLWGIVLLIVLYSLYLSLFYGVGFIIFRLCATKKWQVLVFASVWPLAEGLRSLGPLGNTVSSLGYAQTENFGLLPWASIFGVFGVSFITALCTGFIVTIFISREWFKWSFATVALTFGLLTFGYYLHYFYSPPFDKMIDTLVVQPNHEQAFKLDKQNYDHIRLDLILQSKIHITRDTELIVWPETIAPDHNLANKTFLSNLRYLGLSDQRYLLFGTPFYNNKNFYNAAFLYPQRFMKPSKDDLYYKKNKLMPFGEYWPLKSWFSRVGLDNIVPGADYSSGTKKRMLVSNKARIGTSICLESIYPSHFPAFVQQNANLLVTIANNAWFFNSSAAKKLLQMNVLRAVENHRSLILCANTGHSAIISPKGRIVDVLQMDKKDVLEAPVKLYTNKTIYSRYPNLIFILSGLVCLIPLGFQLRRRQK